MKWKVADKLATYEMFEEHLLLQLEGQGVAEDQWFMYIIQQAGEQSWECWNNIKQTVDKKQPKEVLTALEKGFEKFDTYWK